MHKIWIKATVIHGNQLGKKIHIPTINLDNPSLMDKYKLGVYAAKVKIGKKEYLGSLYYGPKTINKETVNSLEIHIIGFRGNLYGKEISFFPLDFIRKPLKFTSLEQMQKVITDDNKKINLLK